MSGDIKKLPDNVVPFGRREKKEEEDNPTEEVNLEEQNKKLYEKLQADARARRTSNNANVTRSYRLTTRTPDRRD